MHTKFAETLTSNCPKSVAKLYKALEGHPKSGWYWERHCHSKIKQVGFEKLLGWENLFVHRSWQVFINAYVHDFKIAGKGPLSHIWKVLRDAGLDVDDPIKNDNSDEDEEFLAIALTKSSNKMCTSNYIHVYILYICRPCQIIQHHVRLCTCI